MALFSRFDTTRLLKGMLLLGAIAAAWKFEQPSRPAETDAPRNFAPGANAPAPPVSAFRMPWSWWKRVLLNTYEEIGKDRLLAVGAGVVFYALLAIFPAITAFVSFYGLFASYSTIDQHVSLLGYVLPAGGLDIVRDQIGRITSGQDGKLSVAFATGVLIALWSANAGVRAMIDALNVIEGKEENRGFFRLNAVSLTFTLGAIVFLLLAVGAVVAFPLVMSTFGLDRITDLTTWLVRWPALFTIVLVAVAVLYRFGPSGGPWRGWISPGALFATVAWLGGSALLSLYLSNFADYNATYGSLGAAIGLMMWMWLSAIVVLAGAELDSEIDKLR